MTSIVLADDHHVLREALHILLERQPGYQVVAETGDGLEAIHLVERHNPDILIVDMVMPGLTGLEVARRAGRSSPGTRVIILSMYDAESYVVDALNAGVAGYVLKRSSSQELVFAIQQALEGNLFLSPSLNERAIQAYIQRSHESRMDDPLDTLTQREVEIFHLSAGGLSNPQIAERLTLSTRTVETHRSNLMKKLGLKSQTELIKYAIQKGVV